MSFSEDDLLPVSALQHLEFCERQWGLIHLEGVWDENPLTMEGRHLHDRVDVQEIEVRGDVRIARGLRLRSLRFGLSGKADVVEFHRVRDDGKDSPGRGAGMLLEGVPGLWRPVPVEYKRGKPKAGHCDEVQLCAQALCLEEMTGAAVPEGALFYGKTKRRYTVPFDKALRERTEALSARLHRLFDAGVTPGAKYEKKCRSCSLIEFCMPKALRGAGRVKKYLMDAVGDADMEGLE